MNFFLKTPILLLNMVTESDWQRSKQEPKYREEFLASVDLEDAARFMHVIYVPIEPSYDDVPSQLMVTCPSLPSRFFFIGFRSTVKVFPRAFSGEFYETLGDFQSSLIDHEGYHAREFYQNPGMSIIHYPFEVWWDGIRFSGKRRHRLLQKLREDYRAYNVRELRVIKNQVENIHRRNCSEKFLQHTLRDYGHLTDLAQSYVRNPIE